MTVHISLKFRCSKDWNAYIARMKETCATNPAALQAEVYDDIANSHDPSVTQVYVSASGLCEAIAKSRDLAVP